MAIESPAGPRDEAVEVAGDPTALLPLTHLAADLARTGWA